MKTNQAAQQVTVSPDAQSILIRYPAGLAEHRIAEIRQPPSRPIQKIESYSEISDLISNVSAVAYDNKSNWILCTTCKSVLDSRMHESVIWIIGNGTQKRFSRNVSLRILKISTIPSSEIFTILFDDGHIDFLDMSSLAIVGTSKIPTGTRISAIVDFFSNSKHSIFLENSNYFELISNENLFNNYLKYSQVTTPGGFKESAHREREEIIPVSPVVESNTPTLYIPNPFPISEKTRNAHYRANFRLPINESAFQFLIYSGPLFENHKELWRNHLHGNGDDEMIIFRSERLTTRLVEILALLSVWESMSRGGDELLRSPDLIPRLVFPFVKLFAKSSHHFCFELLVFIFSNFFPGWFARMGGYPLKVVADIDSLLADTDGKLYRHLQDLISGGLVDENRASLKSVGCVVYDHNCATMMTEILPVTTWIHMLDLLSLSVKNLGRKKIDEKIFLKFFIQFLIFKKSEIFKINDISGFLEILTTQDDLISTRDVEVVFSRALMMTASDYRLVYLSDTGNSYPPTR